VFVNPIPSSAISSPVPFFPSPGPGSSGYNIAGNGTATTGTANFGNTFGTATFNGTWKLYVADQGNLANNTHINSWSLTFTFSGGFTAPIQIDPAGGAAFQVKNITGGCSGSVCATGPVPSVLGVTGIFMGAKGDHIATGWNALTTSGPSVRAQTVKILTCAPSC